MITRSRSRRLAAAVSSTWDYTPALPLPAEIVELIFSHLDTNSFFVALQACKHFWVVGSSRKNLIQQINSIPGHPCAIENLCTRDVFRVYRRRATKAACGVDTIVDVKGRSLGSDALRSLSLMTTFNIKNDQQVNVLAVPLQNGSVAVYELFADDVSLMSTILPDVSEAGSDVRVHALAFSVSGDLAVLYGELDWCCPGHTKNKCTSCRRLNSTTLVYRYKASIYHRSAADNEGASYRRVYASPFLEHQGDLWVPTSIGLSFDSSLCIMWRVPEGPEIFSMSFRSPSGPDDSDIHQWSAKSVSVSTASTWQSPIFARTTFADYDQSIVLYAAGIPVPIAKLSWPEPDTDNDLQVHETTSLTEFGNHEFLELFAFGLPFFGTHSSFESPSGDGKMCLKSYLALAWIIPKSGGTHGLCLARLSCEIQASQCCHHLHLSRTSRGMRRKIVAFLAGWTNTSSSLGTIAAISADGHRIAVATWNTVLIWTIEPDLLCEGPLVVYFPPHDFNVRKDLGRIRSVQLPSQGVVHSLHWVDQNNLYAVTDLGLAKWYIGHLRSGKVDSDLVTEPAQKRLKRK